MCRLLSIPDSWAGVMNSWWLMVDNSYSHSHNVGEIAFTHSCTLVEKGLNAHLTIGILGCHGGKMTKRTGKTDSGGTKGMFEAYHTPATITIQSPNISGT